MKKSVLILVVICAFMCIGADECVQQSGRHMAEKKQKEMIITAENQIPIPTISYFQEKRTITKWAERWDKANVPTFVYLVSFGKVLGYYVADGKPASTRSYIMPEDEVVGVGESRVVLSAPDIDGTYGDNNAGIRFFTAEGVAVEWAGDGAAYLYSDALIDFGYEVPRLRVRN